MVGFERAKMTLLCSDRLFSPANAFIRYIKALAGENNRSLHKSVIFARFLSQ